MDVFDSAIRAKGDIAGVFEYDGARDPQNASAYFYLYRADGKEADSIIDVLHIRSGAWPITKADIAVKWDKSERRVGLFVFGKLAAAFDIETGKKHDGGYGRDFQADISWD